MENSSILALPFIVMGSTLFVMLPGMEFTPLAATEAGADATHGAAATDTDGLTLSCLHGKEVHR